MRRSLYILAMVAGATLLHSCTAMFNSMAYGSSDLYRTDNRVAVAERLRAEAEAEAAEAEARRAQWEARQAAAEAERAEAEYYASLRDEEPNFLNIVADDYQSAYARRLYGFQSPTYRLPSSYYNLLGNSALFYASAYDPAFYNVMVSGDQVWVEPRYITSMFGSWGAVNITFGLYSSPWTYGWSYRANPFYYSCWGYPRYSWYDWNWNICYNPWHSSWWDPWYYHYYPHYHHHHGGYYPPQRPPQHRPGYNDPNHGRPGHNHVTGSGASSGRPNQNLNGDRGSTADRYTSPTTNRNYGNKDSNRRPVSGSTSQGIYKGSNTTVGGKSTISIGSSSSKPGGSTSTRVEVPTKGGSSVSTGSSSTGSNKGSASNFRQGTTSSRSTAVSGGKSSSSSSSTKVGGSTSSRRGTSVGSSSSKSSSSNSSSSYRSSSSSSRSNSSSSYRSSSSSSSRNSVTGYNASSSSRSSSGYSSGSSSGGGSRSGGGGSTSSRR